MTPCPVCVFAAQNVSSETLSGIECFNCGGDLGDHDLEHRESVPPSKAFAVNRDTVRRWEIGS